LALLESKLAVRDPARLSSVDWLAVRSAASVSSSALRLNPAFHSVPGDIEAWERVRPDIQLEK